MKLLPSLRAANLQPGQTVLLRLDLDVPLVRRKIKNDYRLRRALPTIQLLQKHQLRVVIMGHLGRPGGKFQKELSLSPIAKHLGQLLNQKIVFIKDPFCLEGVSRIGRLKAGEIGMLENLRFWPGEEKNSSRFAKKLSQLAELYVNNAFAVSHRRHASVSAIKYYLPSYAGFLLEEEVVNLNKALRPQQPLVLVVGGAKIKTKIGLINNFLRRAQYILVGGALAPNFLEAKGYFMGRSLVSKPNIALARHYKRHRKIILPVDAVVKNKKTGKVTVKKINQLTEDEAMFDIGPNTISLYASLIKQARTIVWNGPMGLFEVNHFRHGTIALAQTIAARSRGKAFGLVGGGETIEALELSKMFNYVDWVSTGGGAMLAYLGGEEMPGLYV